MILLCNQCHKENPNAISYDSYIQWLKSRKKIPDKAFGVYWSGRAMIEYKNIYGSDFDVDLKTTDIDIETYIKIVNYVKGHFKMYKGPHRRNPVNTALLLREIFIKCNDKKFREQIKTQNEVFDREYEKELEENIDNELKELKNKRVKLIIKS